MLLKYIKSVKSHFLQFILLTYSLSSFAINGGLPTTSGVSPSVVNVIFAKSPCAGVVIAPNVVATAAHCIDQNGAPLMVAYIQPNISTVECNIQNVLEYKFEPSAKLTKFGRHTPDIALIKIEAPLCDAKPAFLSPKSIKAGDKVFMAGHIGNDYPYGVSSAILVETIDFSNIYDHVYAKKESYVEKQIKNFLDEGPMNYVFAIPTQLGETICAGDSGGPVYSEGENGEMLLHGLNGLTLVNEKLGSMQECGNAYVQAFTPIAPYLDWIESTIEGWENRL